MPVDDLNGAADNQRIKPKDRPREDCCEVLEGLGFRV